MERRLPRHRRRLVRRAQRPPSERFTRDGDTKAACLLASTGRERRTSRYDGLHVGEPQAEEVVARTVVYRRW